MKSLAATILFLLTSLHAFAADSEGTGTSPQNANSSNDVSCFVIFQKDADSEGTGTNADSDGGGTKADSEGTGTKPVLVCTDKQ